MNDAASPPLDCTDLRDPLLIFTDLSAALTGFDQVELAGTGLIEKYYDTLLSIIGERQAGHLFLAARDALAADGVNPDGDELRTKVVESKRFGPVVISLIKLWYLGSWYPLPAAYCDANGSTAGDVEHVVSAQAYREGLVWIAAGAHPMGAKPPGFGSWAMPPSLRVS